MECTVEKTAKLTGLLRNLQDVSDSLGTFVYWQDLDGFYLGCNRAFKKLLSEANIHTIDGLHDDDLPWVEKQYPTNIQLKNEPSITMNEALLIQDDKVCLSSSKTPLYDGERIIGIISSASDITDLTKQSIYFNNLVSTSPVLLYWKDKNSLFLGANDSLAKTTPFDKGADLVGKTDFDITSKEKARSIRENDLQIMSTQEPNVFEEIGIDQEGDQLSVLSYKSPIIDKQGNSIGIMGVSINITEMKQLENALRKSKEDAECANRAKSEFLACMSHDLKTPLNGILGISELLLLSEDTTTGQKSMLRELNKSGAYLKQIIDDILVLAKLETDRLKLEKEKLNLHRLAMEAITKLKFHANLNNVELLTYYNESLPVFFNGDKKRILQIIMNLLSNAIKFTTGGCVLLAFEPVQETNQDICIQISIEDTGIGIPDNKIDSVFEKFVQVESSYQSKYDGTGLGLSIVQNLAEGMNGKVGVNSQLGNGATFWCQIVIEKYSVDNILQDWFDENPEIFVTIINNDSQYEDIIFEKLNFKNTAKISYDDFKLIDDKILRILFIDGNELNTIPENWLHKKNLSIITYGNGLIPKQENHMGLHYNLADGDKELLNVLEDAKDILKEFNHSELISSLAKKEVNILMIEDDHTNQKIQSSFLSRLGFSCIIADCGTKAVELCHENRYDLVFMDLGLPDMSGYELVKKVRGLVHGPIIALTAHSSEEDKKSCLDAGMDDFLSKPLSYNQLQSILDKWICS